VIKIEDVAPIHRMLAIVPFVERLRSSEDRTSVRKEAVSLRIWERLRFGDIFIHLCAVYFPRINDLTSSV
jgi:hypothetical protein